MASEIERKFLVSDLSCVAGSEGLRIVQGYLSKDPERTVRVRLAGEQAWITIKGRSKGISRAEYEYPIPLEDAKDLLGLCLPSVIDKTRHCIDFSGHVWEVDVFHGANEGLVVAEVELASENERPELPPWVDLEVSSDPRYFNSRLASAPYGAWKA